MTLSRDRGTERHFFGYGTPQHLLVSLDTIYTATISLVTHHEALEPVAKVELHTNEVGGRPRSAVPAIG